MYAIKMPLNQKSQPPILKEVAIKYFGGGGGNRIQFVVFQQSHTTQTLYTQNHLITIV